MNDGKQVAYAQPVGQPQPTYAQPQVAVDPRVAMRGGVSLELSEESGSCKEQLLRAPKGLHSRCFY